LCALCGQLIAHASFPQFPDNGCYNRKLYTAEDLKAEFACRQCSGLPGILAWIEANHDPYIIDIDTSPVGETRCNDDASTASLPSREHVITGITFYDFGLEALSGYEITPLPISFGARPKRQVLARSWNPRYSNTGLLRRWLIDCDSFHGSKCRQPVTPRPRHRMVLIDTQRFCLVESDGSEDYATLS
jgi:hypothetical protein